MSIDELVQLRKTVQELSGDFLELPRDVRKRPVLLVVAEVELEGADEGLGGVH